MSEKPCTCKDCVSAAEQKEKHFNHKFYGDARKIWVNHQLSQIQKGSEKYPEPFTPSSWSNEQLVEHAIQENVDQLHYIVGMKERMEQQEAQIKLLESKLNYMDSLKKDLSISFEANKKLASEIRKLKSKNTTLENAENYLLECRTNQSKTIKKLESQLKDLESENRTLKGEF